ncbi:hypothetical protein [Marinilabilia rubra]|uniref:DUF2007 domain-containing protein n=1 Tax=Marinilabilia rubra TaxID=2162893 RepID=A0A2U2B606_9BACT|nr:hypothetical protein [Marinilabilia rubra]PWD98485.1 hypothetical protein DDZ16_15520 [Marinilabilia rubra]
MESNEHSVKVFSGTEQEAKNLRKKLEEHSIPSKIRDEIEDKEPEGLRGTPPANVNLFVNGSDIRKADPLIKDFLNEIHR